MTLHSAHAEQTVFVIDDDEAVRDALQMLMTAAGLKVQTFAAAKTFLAEYRVGMRGCLVLDIRMPGLSGLELQDELHRRRIRLPIIFLTGHGDVPLAVRAVKNGACDFIEKPHEEHRLVLAVLNALRTDALQGKARGTAAADMPDALDARLNALSAREREVLDRVLDGRQTKEIAQELCISVKTVEFHRVRIREKLGVTSLAELFKLFRGRPPGSENT